MWTLTREPQPKSAMDWLRRVKNEGRIPSRKPTGATVKYDRIVFKDESAVSLDNKGKDIVFLECRGEKYGPGPCDYDYEVMGIDSSLVPRWVQKHLMSRHGGYGK